MTTLLNFLSLGTLKHWKVDLPYKRVGKISITILFALFLVILFSAIVNNNTVTQAVSSPNILVILMDDLDENSFNQLLQANKLPNIKKYLLDRGVRFTESFVTNSACCPSRATFLTGQYAHNHSVLSVGGPEGGYPRFHKPEFGGSPNRTTIATLLDETYYTGYVGKYMNTYKPTDDIPAGWDFWRGMALNQAHDFPYAMMAGAYTLVGRDNPAATPTRLMPNVYQTKQIGDLGKAFVSRKNVSWSWAHSNHNKKPFFLVLAPTAPHTVNENVQRFGLDSGELDDVSVKIVDGKPVTQTNGQFGQRVLADYGNNLVVNRKKINFMGYTKEDYREAGCPSFAGGCLRSGSITGSAPITGFNLPSLNQPGFNLADCKKENKPAWICERWKELEDDNTPRLKRLHLDRLESMLSVDVMVGEVLGALEGAGHLDNTLIIFTSDNGFVLGEHRLGNKQTPYEESIRVPLIIRQPNAPAGATKNAQLVANIDWAPTILDYAGFNNWDSLTLADGSQFNIDGRSLRPLLDGGSPAWRQWVLIEHWNIHNDNNMPREDLFWVVPDYVGIRTAKDAQDKGKKWKNSLYVEYFDHQGRPNFIEHYDMLTDTHQIHNKPQGTPYTTARRFLKWMLDGLRNCAGATCRRGETYEDVDTNLLTGVSRYTQPNGPCNGKTGDGCTFDTRTLFYDTNGELIESISIDNNYYNYRGGRPHVGSATLSGVGRYMSTEEGPCSSSSCKFDTRSVFYDSHGNLIESISASYQYYNYRNRDYWFKGYLYKDAPRYQDIPLLPQAGPCENEQCTFESRSHVKIGDGFVESITARGKFYNYKNGVKWGNLNGTDLHDIPKYAFGPCQHAPTNEPCVFDTRAHVVINGQTVESITAYGRYFNFVNNYPWRNNVSLSSTSNRVNNHDFSDTNGPLEQATNRVYLYLPLVMK